MSTENKNTKEKFNWKTETIRAVIYGVMFGLVTVFMKRMGII